MEKSKIDRINAAGKKGQGHRSDRARDRRARRFAQGVSGRYARGLQTALDSTYVRTADGAKIPYAEYAKLSKH